MKRLFLFLLRKYSKTESQRMKIYKELWYQVKNEYYEQSAFGNVYNMNTEILMSNPFFQSIVIMGNEDELNMLRRGLSKSFDKSVDYTMKEFPLNKGTFKK